MLDKRLQESIEKESKRQDEHIELIASENFVSKAVLQTAGSILTNKYAEGYPNNRYYGGCEYIDEVEAEYRAEMESEFRASMSDYY